MIRVVALVTLPIFATSAFAQQGGVETPVEQPVQAAPAQTSAPVTAGSILMKQLDDAFVEVFEKVAPAVVVVQAEAKPTNEDEGGAGLPFDFNNPPGGGGGLHQFRLPLPSQPSEGSGFIVRENGYILTNNHVISGAEQLKVRLRDGRTFPAKVVGVDPKTDIAVIKIDAEKLPVAELGDSDAVRVGQIACAIGVPYQLDYSFSAGWVSAKGRTALASVMDPQIVYEDYIQTDAFINPGNSGGPLFDVNGKVIGMNTLINGIGRGLGFAIPSNMLRTVGDSLIATGRVVRPWLGIAIETLRENSPLAQHLKGISRGVVVERIEADTPAFKSDLRPTDVITHLDNVELATAQDLQKEVLKKKVGQEITLTVWRNGNSLQIPVTTGQLPDNVSRAANRSQPQDAPPAVGSFGLTFEDVPAGGETAGAVVSAVAPDSPAAQTDIRVGDVITEVDSKPVTSGKDFGELVKQGDVSRGIILVLDRSGQKTYAVLRSERR